MKKSYNDLILKMEAGAKIGREIMMAVRKLGLPYLMDDVTEGRGNCFPLAILQQCRREEIHSNLDVSIRQITDGNNPTLLRRAVFQFIENSQNYQIREFKENYKNIIANGDAFSILKILDFVFPISYS